MSVHKNSTVNRADKVLPKAAPSSPASSNGGELRDLLEATVRELARRTHLPRVCAWINQPGNESPELMASHGLIQNETISIAPAQFASFRQMVRPTDLGARSLPPELPEFARTSGLTAAVAVDSSDEGNKNTPMIDVVLVVGGEEDPLGNVRPRTLAALAEAEKKLRGPLQTLLEDQQLLDTDQATKNLQHLDRRAALGELVSEIIHEVRNPLVAIKTFLQLLPGHLDDPDFIDDFRGVALDEVGRLERLLDSVLRQARAKPPGESSGPADIPETFERMTHLVSHRARSRQIRIQQKTPDDLPAVEISADALGQVILNLLLNALDAAQEGGQVELVASRVAESHEVEIRIDDDGPGIPAQDRKKVFETFHSTRPDQPGGLGLSISQKIIRAAGGRIEIQDAASGGASLRIRLPLFKEGAE